MRMHLLALPNCQTTKAYSLDGFCQTTIRFAKLLRELGHTVLLYASEDNEAPCDELICCITKEEQEILLQTTPYQYAAFDDRWPLWQLGNARMIREIKKRKETRDIILTIGGASQKNVINAFPDLLGVEYSIGYVQSFAKYRVFQSTAWMHFTYGAQKIEDGRYFDAVIPPPFDAEEFTPAEKKQDYALYVGRLVPRKGIGVACRSAEAAGVELRVIGHGDEKLVTHGAKYLGALSSAERNQTMAEACAVICPTQYIEPFNCVAVEAQLAGTPVISTTWGGFTETIEQGVTGFRCSYLGEFAQAIKDAPALDSKYIRTRAIDKYSIASLKHTYQKYFDRLSLLWDAGWETPPSAIKS